MLIRHTLHTLFLLSVVMTGTACGVSSPEATAVAAMEALCSGDTESFRQDLTNHSRLFYDGLLAMSPDSFTCLGPTQVGAVRVRHARDGWQLLELSSAGSVANLAMVLEEGRWRIDLFHTEEGLFHLNDAINSEVSD